MLKKVLKSKKIVTLLLSLFLVCSTSFTQYAYAANVYLIRAYADISSIYPHTSKSFVAKTERINFFWTLDTTASYSSTCIIEKLVGTNWVQVYSETIGGLSGLNTSIASTPGSTYRFRFTSTDLRLNRLYYYAYEMIR